MSASQYPEEEVVEGVLVDVEGVLSAIGTPSTSDGATMRARSRRAMNVAMDVKATMMMMMLKFVVGLEKERIGLISPRVLATCAGRL